MLLKFSFVLKNTVMEVKFSDDFSKSMRLISLNLPFIKALFNSFLRVNENLDPDYFVVVNIESVSLFLEAEILDGVTLQGSFIFDGDDYFWDTFRIRAGIEKCFALQISAYFNGTIVRFLD